MTAHKGQFPEFYITSAQPCPYLPGKLERKLFTHLTRDKAPSLIDTLLRGGFRRSQNIAYMPYCDACRGCVSVRVLAQEFAPNRGFRRTLKANADLIATRVPAVPTTEQYSLFRGYIDARHNDGGMAEMSVLDYATMIEDSAVDTFITEYRLKPDHAGPRDNRGRGPLMGVALCDVLSDGISMVYSFYEPDLHARSLGTFMVLDHIAYARDRGLPYVYLGYWIDGSRKMAYKTRFQPQEHLVARGWVRAQS